MIGERKEGRKELIPWLKANEKIAEVVSTYLFGNRYGCDLRVPSDHHHLCTYVRNVMSCQ